MVGTVLGATDDLLRRALIIVGQVKEVADFVEQTQLAFFLGDVLADDDQAILLGAGAGPIVPVGNVLMTKPERFELTLADDLVLDVVGTLARRGFGIGP